MDVDLNCSYNWVNDSIGTLECDTVIGSDYIVIQVVLGLILLYSTYRFFKWIGRESYNGVKEFNESLEEEIEND